VGSDLLVFLVPPGRGTAGVDGREGTVGTLAAGLENGTIEIWDARSLLTGALGSERVASRRLAGGADQAWASGLAVR